jgi:hypothetical protein
MWTKKLFRRGLKYFSFYESIQVIADDTVLGLSTLYGKRKSVEKQKKSKSVLVILITSI